jgi:hypothetical protein
LEFFILGKLKKQLEGLKGKVPLLGKTAPKSSDGDDDEIEEMDEEVLSEDATGEMTAEELEEIDEEEIDEDDSVSDEPVWKTKLKEQLPFLAKFLNNSKKPSLGVKNKKNKNTDDEDVTDPDIAVPAADEKKKKLIRVVLIVAILYFVADTFMTSDEPEVSEAPVEVPAHERKKKKRNLEAEKPKEETPVAVEETPVAVEETPVAVEETPVAIEETPVAIEETPVDESIPTDLVLDTPREEDEENIDIEEASTPDVPDTVDTSDLFLGDSTPEADDPFGGQVEDSDQIFDTPVADNNDMTEQILTDLEKQIESNKKDDVEAESTYVEPPPYDYFGRGLVYNCKGKHWACVDAPSFKICQQNFRALKGQGRSKECYADSVYQTDSACAWVQKKKIVGNAKTDFCN